MKPNPISPTVSLMPQSCPVWRGRAVGRSAGLATFETVDPEGGDAEFEFEAELWRWEGAQAWVFVSVPADLADVIEEIHGEHARGFRSLRVAVAVGGHEWRTSIFPDSKRGTYLLPVKREIRRRVGVDVGDRRGGCAVRALSGRGRGARRTAGAP